MRGQDGGRKSEISFKLVSKSSCKIAVKGELQFLSALFENEEPLRLHLFF